MNSDVEAESLDRTSFLFCLVGQTLISKARVRDRDEMRAVRKSIILSIPKPQRL